jgi:hypothetical protein
MRGKAETGNSGLRATSVQLHHPCFLKINTPWIVVLLEMWIQMLMVMSLAMLKEIVTVPSQVTVNSIKTNLRKLKW